MYDIASLGVIALSISLVLLISLVHSSLALADLGRAQEGKQRGQRLDRWLTSLLSSVGLKPSLS